VAATETELNVFPADPGIFQRELDGFGTHLHRGLLEPAKWVKAHPDDGYIIGHFRFSF
jgi:hypothetical protein